MIQDDIRKIHVESMNSMPGYVKVGLKSNVENGVLTLFSILKVNESEYDRYCRERESKL